MISGNFYLPSGAVQPAGTTSGLWEGLVLRKERQRSPQFLSNSQGFPNVVDSVGERCPLTTKFDLGTNIR
jgi:hypothetical protein